MTDRTESLYGVKQSSKTKTREISSSTSLAFSTNLASLISVASSKTAASTSAGRPHPNKSKSDIFTAHNKNVKKRSAADLVDDGEQRHKTAAELGTVDTDILHRSKRRMEEKARLYTAMKRGDYVASTDGRDERGLVDFDRKWAEQQGHDNEEITSSGSDNDDGDGNQELVEYKDEFGRTRKGTKAEAAREERHRRIQANAAEEEERFSARPTMPTNIIFGDTVQYNAFNPDEVIAERMADLAKKRDKSATPPPDSHYDANAEVRTKGTGFYGFSKDAEGRKKEMEALERERLETARARKEKDALKHKRRKEVEDRRRLISEQRTKAQADKFLSGFQLPDEQEPAGDTR